MKLGMKYFVLILFIAAVSILVFRQLLVWREEIEEPRLCAHFSKNGFEVGPPQLDAETANQYGACGYTEAPSTTPQFWSPTKHVVLRSVFWDPRRLKGFEQGFWVFLVEAEKQIVKNNFILGVMIGNLTYTNIDVHELKWNRYIDSVCKKLTHCYLMLRCNAPIQPNPTHAAVLFRVESNGCIYSAVSEHPVLIRNLSQPKPKNSVVSCLAPGYGNPRFLPHFLRYEKVTGVSHVHMIGEQSIVAALDHPDVKGAIEEGFLTVDIWPRWFSMWQIYYHSQLLAYQDCLYRFLGSYEYVFTHDADDFFVPLLQDQKTLGYYLSRHCPRGTCKFSWEEFEPKGLTFTGPIGEDGNVTDKVVTKHSRVPRLVYKCVHRIDDLFELEIHGGERWKEEGFLLKTCCASKHVPRTEAYVAHLRI